MEILIIWFLYICDMRGAFDDFKVLSGRIVTQLGKAMPWVQLTVYIAFLILAIVSLFWYN